jgi:hypothetical protein
VSAILSGCALEVLNVGPYEAWGAVAGTLPHSEGKEQIAGPGRLPVPELLMADRFVALTRVRAATWGDGYEFRVRCKEKTCERYKKPFLWEIPLSELEVKPLPKASRERVAQKQLTFEFVLGGKKAKFKLQQGLDELNAPDLSELPKSKIFLAQCASRLIYVEGIDVTDFDNLLAWVGELDLQDVLEATSLYDSVDGGMETNTMVECPDCGLEFDIAVPFDSQSFLLPDKKTPAGKRLAEPIS